MSVSSGRALRALILVAACATAGPMRAETGHLWELRTEMVMTGEFDGMVPSNTHKVCMPGRQPQTPGMDDGACEILESSRTGNRGHWKARCKDGVTVTSDFTYLGETAYDGIVSSSTAGGTVKMKIAGRRLGPCVLGAGRAAPAAVGSQAPDDAAPRRPFDGAVPDVRSVAGDGEYQSGEELSASVPGAVSEELRGRLIQEGTDRLRGLLRF